MFHPASVFLASKYLLSIHNKQPLHVLLYFSIFATIISTASLTLTLTIVDGFETTTKNTFQGIYGDYIVQSPNGQFDNERFELFIQEKFPEIKALSPHITQQVLVDSNIKDAKPIPALLTGIDIDKELNVTALKNTLQHQQQKFNDQYAVFMGKGLAHQLQITQGDTVIILYPENITKSSMQFSHIKMYVQDIFKTGIDDIDNSVIYCSLDLCKKIFPHEGPQQITLKFNHAKDINKTIEKLRKTTDLYFFDWQDLYPAIISALKLERMALLLVLSIIILLASLLIMSSLCSLIIHKKHDLVILHYLGLSQRNIAQIFIIIGQVIAWLGSIFGIILGLIIALFLKYSHIIKLPDVYYSSYLPIEIHISTPFFVLMLTLFLTAFSSFMPYWFIKKTVN